MKKIAAILMSLLCTISLFSACSSKPQTPAVESTAVGTDSAQSENTDATAEFSGTVLEFLDSSGAGSVLAETLTEIVADFEAETGIRVELSFPGGSYEELMKTRMAANDLPDIWATHGWAVNRYGEYLRPLNDQSYTANIDSRILSRVSDSDGNILALPLNLDFSGMVYNKTVLDEAGVDIDQVLTWADFNDALEKVKNIGKIGIYYGGKDNWTIAQTFNCTAPSLLTNDDSNNEREALLNGTFDWSHWTVLNEMIHDWQQKGYINQDCVTSDYLSSCEAFARNEVAFLFNTQQAIIQGYNTNPDLKAGIMPVPAKDSTTKPHLVVAESIAYGVWKDSENEEAALALLEFLARPENCSKMASASGSPAGLTNATSELGAMGEEIEKLSTRQDAYIYVSYFDRVYLPSGMWDDLGVAGSEILANPESGVEKATEMLRQSYLDKFAQMS